MKDGSGWLLENGRQVSTRTALSKTILAIWLPCWPIQRLVAANDALRRTRIILYRNHPQQGQIVTAVSPAAVLGGVRIGMPLSEAKSLGQRHDGGGAAVACHVFQHDPGADQRQLEQLAMDCECFSPLVGLVSTSEAAGPAGLWLDVGSVLHLFGGASGLQTSVARHFQDRGYTIRQAVAATPGVAWGLARFDENRMPDESGGGGLNQDAFERLPVAALRLSSGTIDNLRQLGIERVEQIRQLPRRGLRSRFGDELTRRLDQADGVIDEVITAIHSPPDYQAEQTLDYPVSDRDAILVVLSRLARELCDRMRGTQRGGLVWECRLSAPGQGPVELTIKLFQPTATLEHLLPLVEMQLDDALRQGGRCATASPAGAAGGRKPALDFGVVDLRMSVRNCVLLAERQRGLFDENPRRDSLALSQLVNRLASRLGAEHVVRPACCRGVQAEDAACFEPLVGHRGIAGGRSPAPPRRRIRSSRKHRNAGDSQGHSAGGGGMARPPVTGVSPMQRPLVLFSGPREISAVSVDGRPQTDIHEPRLLLVDGQRMPVHRRWGPERIETAWWRGPVVRRDYWRIETVQGRWLWVFRDLRSRQWFWHGEF